MLVAYGFGDEELEEAEKPVAAKPAPIQATTRAMGESRFMLFPGLLACL